jgi:peroxiredoxin
VGIRFLAPSLFVYTHRLDRTRFIEATSFSGERSNVSLLRINDEAPDFTADTTHGPIQFHQWIGDNWAVLFSHPKDFTPVCTTELGAMAGLEGEVAKRGAKVIGLSVDPVENHAKWAVDIQDVTGYAVNYPMIGDVDLKISKLYNMLPAKETGTCEGAARPPTQPSAPSSSSAPTRGSSCSSAIP